MAGCTADAWNFQARAKIKNRGKNPFALRIISGPVGKPAAA
jgi:hypothetical protein